MNHKNHNCNSIEWEDTLEKLKAGKYPYSDWEYRVRFVDTIRKERENGMRFPVLRD